MNFKVIALLTLLSSSISTSFAVEKIPTSCPTVDQLSQIKLQIDNLVELQKPHNGTNANGFPYHDKGLWSAGVNGKFGTEFEWSFTLHSVEGDTANEVLPKLQAQLTTLALHRGPIKDLFDYYCEYHTKDGGAIISMLRF